MRISDWSSDVCSSDLTTDALLPYLRAGQILSLESTTYPGTTEEELLPRVESTGRKVGEDFFLVYSPEREDPGNISFTPRTIPKVCGGHTAACLDVGLAPYGHVLDKVVPVSTPTVAAPPKRSDERCVGEARVR